jgi:adenosylcobinamide kinase/adenosylcobinamide-phosphate guanylyltransferase
MAKIILISGGARSGKSQFAEQQAIKTAADWLYLATCPRALDEEMANRIATHQKQRRGRGWQTREEETELAAVISALPARTNVLIDCLTMWISNLLLAADGRLTETEIAGECRRLLEACQSQTGTFIMVTNEVGGGIVPENALARRYRDLVGRCNQIIAAGAAEVYLTSCGIPLKIK